jgi:hypothetical protein
MFRYVLFETKFTYVAFNAFAAFVLIYLLALLKWFCFILKFPLTKNMASF